MSSEGSFGDTHRLQQTADPWCLSQHTWSCPEKWKVFFLLFLLVLCSGTIGSWWEDSWSYNSGWHEIHPPFSSQRAFLREDGKYRTFKFRCSCLQWCEQIFLCFLISDIFAYLSNSNVWGHHTDFSIRQRQPEYMRKNLDLKPDFRQFGSHLFLNLDPERMCFCSRSPLCQTDGTSAASSAISSVCGQSNSQLSFQN